MKAVIQMANEIYTTQKTGLEPTPLACWSSTTTKEETYSRKNDS